MDYKGNSIENCRIIKLPEIVDERGFLTFIESYKHIPFEIKRIFYVYNVPKGKTRAGHAISIHEFLIAISGSFDLFIDDGFNKKKFHLNESNYGLYLAPLIWCELKNFSNNAVCLVLTSEFFNENDYIRNYETFKKIKQRS